MARRRLIRLRRGTAAEWTSANPTLEAGEPGVETDTGQGKIGDGSTAWNSLDYIGTGGGGASGPAGGVLSGTYPNPGFAADMATQAELDAHTGDTTDAHDASAISIADAGGYYTGADVEAALQEIGAGGIGGGGGVTLETPSGTINGSNVTFTLSAEPDPAADLLLFKNGLLQEQGVDYTLSTDTITFTTAPATGSTLLAGMPGGGGGGGGGGAELDYVTTTSDLTVTAASAAAAQTYITGNSVAYDGSTRIMIEFFSVLVSAPSDTVINLWEDSTDLGRIAQYALGGGSCHGVWFRTPAAGSKTHVIKAWRGASNGLVYGSLGAPSFLRITEA